MCRHCPAAPGPPHHRGPTSHPPPRTAARGRARRRGSLRLRLAASWRRSAHSARHCATSSTPASTTSGHACARWRRSTARSLPSRPSTYASADSSGRAPPPLAATGGPLADAGAGWPGSGPRAPPAGPETGGRPAGFAPGEPAVAATGASWPEPSRRSRGAAGATCGDRWLPVSREVGAEASAGTAERCLDRAAGTSARPLLAAVAGVAAGAVETGRSAVADRPSGVPPWPAWRPLSDGGQPVPAAAGESVTAVTAGTPRPGPRRRPAGRIRRAAARRPRPGARPGARACPSARPWPAARPTPGGGRRSRSSG